MIADRKSFMIGVILSVSFVLVLVGIYSPVFDGMNGLQYADRFFNSIAKGSTYYIPEVQQEAAHYEGQQIEATIKMESADDARKTAVLFEESGAVASTAGTEVKIKGDLGMILGAAVKDADMMFNNEGDVLAEKYGYQKQDVMYHWWLGLSALNDELTNQKAFSQAAFIGHVSEKAVEPAYNFFGIKAESASEHAVQLTAMLAFYILYTIWWGFAIYYLFEGLGLRMSGGQKKAEA